MHYDPIILQPGVVLAGKYRIERVLGQGGMGVVAAAYHIHLEQRVALKLMLPHAMGSAESVARFLREARAAARITSEHVARVYDVGTLESGAPYIAMEYLEGADLAQLMVERGRLPVEETIEYLLQACEALAEAHRVGIVHRDLKPANLYLAQRLDGQRLVKVLDFGISKMSGGAAQSDAPATRTSALMGSPLYMSPEQMGSSRDVDARSDIWAIGVVLHEMLSGKPPFDGDTLPQVCARVMSEPPPPLQEIAPGLPPALYEAVNRCLQKQPSARFQSVAELAYALEPLASPRARQSIERISKVLGVTQPSATFPAQAPVAATTANPGVHTGTQATWGGTQPKPAASRSRAPLFIALFATLASLGGVGLWFALHSASSVATGESVGSAPAAAVPAALSAPVVVPAAPVPVTPAPVLATPSDVVAAPSGGAPAVATPPALPAPPPAPASRVVAPAHRPRAAAVEPAAKPTPVPAAAPPPPAPQSAPAPPAPTGRSRL